MTKKDEKEVTSLTNVKLVTPSESLTPLRGTPLRVWMLDIVLPRKEGRNDLAKSRRSEKDSVAARDRRILEFPLSMSSFRVRRLREKRQRENVQAK